MMVMFCFEGLFHRIQETFAAMYQVIFKKNNSPDFSITDECGVDKNEKKNRTRSLLDIQISQPSTLCVHIEDLQDVNAKIKKILGLEEGCSNKIIVRKLSGLLYVVHIINMEEDTDNVTEEIDFKVAVQVYQNDIARAYRLVRGRNKRCVNYSKTIFLVKINDCLEKKLEQDESNSARASPEPELLQIGIFEDNM